MYTNSEFAVQLLLSKSRSANRWLQQLNKYGECYRVPDNRSQDLSETQMKDASAYQWIEFVPNSLRLSGSPNRKLLRLNVGADLVQARGLESIDRHLSWSGLNSSLATEGNEHHDKGSYRRRYVVRVFHLQALEIMPVGSSMNVEEYWRVGGEEVLSVLYKKISKIAVRCMYALGIDYGEVIISAQMDSRFNIERISTMPNLRDARSAELFASAVDEIGTRWHHAETQKDGSSAMMIGMDPEFLLIDQTRNKVVSASRYLNRLGIAGCDAIRIQGRAIYHIAELRPSPGHEPDEMLEHLLHAFSAASARISDKSLVWKAGGMPRRGYPLGGHLHFSGIQLTANLLRVLDNYLALLVAIVEDDSSFQRRPRYGYLGDYRIKEYGGFEYRTLPSFLVSPLVTKGVIALARLIAESENQLLLRPLQQVEICEAFYKGNKETLRTVIPEIVTDIVGLNHYDRYESYISPFLSLVQSGHCWNESNDIRPLWKIVKPS